MVLRDPAALAWLAAAVPLVLLWLVRARRRPVRVPSLLLWERLEREQAGDPAWKRLERALLLALQLGVLALVVAALADPCLPGRAVRGGRLTVVLDASASMQAVDVAPSRFEAARRRARELIAGLPQGAEGRLLVAGGGLEVVCGLTADRAALSRALERAAVTDGSADLREALRLALSLDPPSSGAEVVLVSDAAGLGPEPLPLAGRARVEVVGGPAANFALAEFAVRRDLAEGGRCQGYARLLSRAAAPATVRLDLTCQGVLLDARSVELGAGEERGVVFPRLIFSDGLFELRVTVTGEGALDSLAADSRAYAWLAPARPLSVALAGDASVFARAAFGSMDSVRVTTAGDEGAADLWVGRGPEVPESAGGVFLLDPRPGAAGLEDQGPLAAPEVGLVDAGHPLLAHVDLRQSSVAEARRLRPAPWLSPVAEDLHGSPLLLAGHDGRRRVVVLAFDPARSDLPLSASFPLLAANVAAWVAADRRAPARVLAGEALVLPAAPGGTAPRLVDPDGRTVPVEVDAGLLRTPPLQRAGVWRLEVGGAPGEPLIVAVDAERESSLAPEASVTSAPGLPGDGPGQSGAGEVGLRPVAALLALALAFVELWVWAWQPGAR